jgi:hypothetical protein
MPAAKVNASPKPVTKTAAVIKAKTQPKPVAKKSVDVKPKVTKPV